MIAVVSIICLTAVIMYGMKLYEQRGKNRLDRLADSVGFLRSEHSDNARTITAAMSEIAATRSDLATVSGRLSDLQQAVKDAQLSRIDRMEQQIQGIHARMGSR